MIRRITTLVLCLFMATAAMAQDVSDIERRLRVLEEKIAQMAQTPDVAELRRQIDILTQEIETLKSGAKAQETPAQADASTHGLGAAASKVYRAGEGISFGGYGEFLYQNFDQAGRPANADALRAILYTGYKFNDRVLFNSELEYEHANTERNGEIEVEFAYLDYLINPKFNIRSGLVLMPIGIINEQHEPTSYFGARRPQVDSRIIPTTWNELGVGAFGDVGPLTYRAYLTTSLASETFTATGIRGGRQRGSSAKADDLAVVGRLDWHALEGTTLGASLYTGNSGQERSYGGRVTIVEGHAQALFRGVSLRALVARGTVDDAAAINRANNLTGAAGVGERFDGWYVEGGYDVAPLLRLRGEMSLSPYIRYEELDTQARVPAGFRRNLANDQDILTLGIAYKPIPQTVIKIDWQNVDNAAGTGVDQFNIGLGYIF